MRFFSSKKPTGPAPERSYSGSHTKPFRLIAALLAATLPMFAQQSPWETAVNNLQTSFTGPIAKGLSLVALVIGGLMFAYSEGQAKKVFAGIIFGLGMALGAVNFMAWMFPGV